MSRWVYTITYQSIDARTTAFWCAAWPAYPVWEHLDARIAINDWPGMLGRFFAYQRRRRRPPARHCCNANLEQQYTLPVCPRRYWALKPNHTIWINSFLIVIWDDWTADVTQAWAWAWTLKLPFQAQRSRTSYLFKLIQVLEASNHWCAWCWLDYDLHV